MIREGMFLGNRYEIVSQVGSGGMSDVYKAMDHKLNRFVAIKVLKNEFSQDAGFVEKFVVEAQSAAGLSHPNIVNVYDVGDEQGIHYIVMELVEGITLKSYIEKKRQLTFKEAVSIAIQVGTGIEAAHNNKIIHRDIKPQNIMISRDGKVKVTDFGIARAVSGNTIGSNVMGSVHYTSPEQARGGYVDEKSDIYSLGITLYEMITGRVPFNGETAVAVAVMHIQEEMIPPSRFVDDLPVSVEQIILKCTQKNPDRRYATVGELVMDLKRSLVEPDADFVKLKSDLYDNPTAIINEADLKNLSERYPDLQEAVKEESDDDLTVENFDEEEEDGEEINPKLDKAIIFLGIGAGVIVLLILLYLGGTALGLFKFSGGNSSSSSKSSSEASSGMIEMIDITGKSFEQAKKELKEYELGIKQVSEEESDKYPEGYIISQSVKAGEYVDKNSTIQVVVSSGAKSISVPNVVELEENEAINKIKDYKLNPVRDYQYSDSVEHGYVISQSPKEGDKVKEGDSVNIVISRGPETTSGKVPNILGKTKSEAKTALEEAGFVIGTITEVYSDTYESGVVITQSIAAGSKVKSGTTINVTVSKGKEPAPQPESKPEESSSSETANNNAVSDS